MSEENKPYLMINEEYDEIKINIKHTKPYVKLQQENKQFKKALLDIKEKEKELLHIGWNYNDLKEILDIVNKALEGNNEDNQ